MIPILKDGEAATPECRARLAAAIQSDGCTAVKDFCQECCVLHDLCYRYGIDCYGKPASKREADRAFRRAVDITDVAGCAVQPPRTPDC